MCLAGKTPPRQVRVPDRDRYEEDEGDDDDDDDDITDNIRESIIDYLTYLAPHVQVCTCVCTVKPVIQDT